MGMVRMTASNALSAATGQENTLPDRAGSANDQQPDGEMPYNTEDETMTKAQKTFLAILVALTTALAGAAYANTVCTNGGCVTCDGPLVCINGACTCNGVPIDSN
jgi:hypothetical protein